MTKKQKEFVDTMIKAIMPFNISAELKRVILCQSVLESGYGTKGVNTRGADYNVYALNWYNDDYTKMYDKIALECPQERDGQIITQTEYFCRFKDYSEATACIIHWYDRPYYNGVKDADATYIEIIDIIAKHYATSSSYASSLKRLYKSLGCTEMFVTEQTYIISCGVWVIKWYADNMYNKLKVNGFDASLITQPDGTYRVVVYTSNYVKTSKRLSNMGVAHFLM